MQGHCHFIHVCLKQIVSEGTKGCSRFSFLPQVTSQYINGLPFQNMLLLCGLRPDLGGGGKKKPIPSILKRINKCIEKENGHKHRSFYSECHDADESTECTWRAKRRAAEDKRARTVIRRGQRALATFRPQHHLSPQPLLDF